ncbi:hypothetical protein GXP67_20855 [Rhodocytophaga rosea]|uniref:Uncharacterized protein n=1 Tax=Rhodocytophaga rosea TaxID=2704465 RepID=A0A6C0GLM5_9BACT|nr:hypothetical protein [Rhodocytophaga rosea]QHT68925.1 hypothetical protein GXP67_20855 [Rhodocytophaga rosea]
MQNNNVELNLVIELLEKKKQELLEEVKTEQGANPEKITLKNQVIRAIHCLQICQEFNISKGEISFLRIPEGGSDSFYTSFYIVDEAEINKVDNWAIKKLDGKPIELSCFDIIGKR